MIASTKVMDSLKAIGLNLYERRIWVALLARGASTAGELSEIANVPRSRAYDILQSLAEKGLVIVQSGKPLRFIAVNPEEALEGLKKFQEEKIREFNERIDEIKNSEVMKELNQLYAKGLKIVEPAELSGAIKGVRLLRKYLDSIFSKASKRIELVLTPEGLIDIYSTHFNLLKQAKERGVEIRILTHYNPKIKEVLKALSGVAKIRFIDTSKTPISGRFVIIDENEVLLGLTPPEKVHETQYLTFWSRSEHAAKDILSPLFRLAWQNSKEAKI